MQLFTHRLRQIAFAGLLASVLAGLAVGSSYAWGPDRPTLTGTTPADHVVFNSVREGNPYGDERNFIRLKDASLGDSTYADDTKVEPGKEYVAYIYFHNNASTTLNDAAHNYAGIARNTKLRIAIPSVLEANKRTGMTAYISADNADPSEVYDDAFMTATETMSFNFVPGSAVIYSHGAVNGQKLPDSVFTSGAHIGYDALDGNLPGCAEYSGYVLARFVTSQPNFSVTKQVSATGQNKWGEVYAAKVGDTVDFLVTYQNTGNTQQDNVFIKDVLPKGLTYVNGSSVLANSVTPKGEKISNNVVAKGINIGSYAPKGNAFLKFSAKVDDVQALCGENALKNVATVSTDNGQKSDDATVTVNVECKPNECKPGIPEGDERCKDVPAVTELPSTGPRETFIVLTVLIAAVAFATYEVQKRRKARKAFAAHVAAGTPTHELLEDGRDDKHKEALFVRKDHHDVASHHDAEQQDDETPSDDHTSDEGAPEERQW